MTKQTTSAAKSSSELHYYMWLAVAKSWRGLVALNFTGPSRYLADQCKGCTDPMLQSFLKDAGRKLARCRTSQQTGHLCEAHLSSVLNSACCSGPNGKMGDGDDTCNVTNGTMPKSCDDDPVCMGATQTAATVCPTYFTDDFSLMGLFVDCGGREEQLYAATPVKTNVALWCEDSEEALHDADNNGRRRMMEVAAKRAEEQFAYLDAQSRAPALRQLQDDMPGYPEDPVRWRVIQLI